MTTARTASPRTARAINDRIALELLAEHGPLTAAGLRDLTGLSRPSVADLLDRLSRDGMVAVVGEAGEARRGPNARLYGLVAERAHVVALDVRTQSVALTLADLTGRTVGRAELPIDDDPAGSGSGAVTAVLDALSEAMRGAGVTAVHTAVMGAPGLADPATGALLPVSSLPRWHAALLTALRDRLNGRVLLENEVNLAGIAEHRLGAVRDRDTFVLLWLGHGIGASVVLDGTLRRGASGGAGELGFLPVPGTGGLPSATDCDRGFHSLAASGAVCALARRHGLPADEADDAPAAEAVVRAAAEADDGPRGAFLDELAERVAVAIAAVVAVLDPGCVVLGGEVGRAGGPALAERVGRRLRELSPLATEVRAATVGGSPVLSGALLTALDAVRDELFGPGR
ncbi:ROK family transcriptional regulator [Streptomyces litchfieldiae]|uniref:ROK family transcriptional regulator n=1 Tax=Streptomyces litchfieldiae TaxID=3075543 RepID=A0ABU2MQ47_9ACTN|nr:ROK family transcriptional regulator [Streptomyces sp. DSM 44938]MDT0343743.1 ROK family transcriptional regulator [Streptomyces sp. DSM 44938]